MHLLWPLLVFVAVAVAMLALGIDQKLARVLYAWEGNAWALKDSFIAETVIHTGGRLLSVLAWLCVLVLWIVTLLRAPLALLRRPLAYLLMATAVAAATVAWMKTWTNMDCPWNVIGLGGLQHYHSLFGPRIAGHQGACFPAAHASAGYCWLSLYFFFLTTHPRLRWLGLATALGFGLLFGTTQQLRGAHFLSHDLWSAAVCWICVLAVYLGMRMDRPSRAHRAAVDKAARPPSPARPD